MQLLTEAHRPITSPCLSWAGKTFVSSINSPLRVQKRDELRSYLKERGVGTEVYYPLPLHLAKLLPRPGVPEGVPSRNRSERLRKSCPFRSLRNCDGQPSMSCRRSPRFIVNASLTSISARGWFPRPFLLLFLGLSVRIMPVGEGCDALVDFCMVHLPVLPHEALGLTGHVPCPRLRLVVGPTTGQPFAPRSSLNSQKVSVYTDTHADECSNGPGWMSDRHGGRARYVFPLVTPHGGEGHGVAPGWWGPAYQVFHMREGRLRARPRNPRA